MGQLANEDCLGLKKRCLSGTEDKQSFPIALSFPTKKAGTANRSRRFKVNMKTKLCMVSTPWQLWEQGSGAESLYESGWVCSWKKDLHSLFRTSAEDLAHGLLSYKLLWGRECVREYRCPVSALALATKTREGRDGDVILLGEAHLRRLILFNCILLSLYSVPAAPSSHRCSSHKRN